jgi:hypothetical protein
MYARGKPCRLTKHAYEGIRAERRPIGLEELTLVLDEAQHDDGTTAYRWIKTRTIIVRYRERSDEILIRGASATRSRVPPKMPRA